MIFYVLYSTVLNPLDSTVSGDAGIEPRTVATSALVVRRSKHSARSHPQPPYFPTFLLPTLAAFCTALRLYCIWFWDEGPVLWYGSAQLLSVQPYICFERKKERKKEYLFPNHSALF